MSDDVLKEHSGTVVATVVAMVIATGQWLLGREVKRRDKDIESLKQRHEEHEVRIRAIEVDRVTRGDLSFLNEQLDKMRDRSEERHVELLDRINGP